MSDSIVQIILRTLGLAVVAIASAALFGCPAGDGDRSRSVLDPDDGAEHKEENTRVLTAEERRAVIGYMDIPSGPFVGIETDLWGGFSYKDMDGPEIHARCQNILNTVYISDREAEQLVTALLEWPISKSSSVAIIMPALMLRDDVTEEARLILHRGIWRFMSDSRLMRYRLELRQRTLLVFMISSDATPLYTDLLAMLAKRHPSAETRWFIRYYILLDEDKPWRSTTWAP